MNRQRITLIAMSLLLVLPGFVFVTSCLVMAQQTGLEVEAFDMPSDGGGSIALRWPVLTNEDGKDGDATYQVLVSDQADGEFTPRVEFAADTHYETDLEGPWWVWGTKRPDWHFVQVQSDTEFQLTNGTAYFFKVVFVASDGQKRTQSPVISATPQANVFNWVKVNNLLLMLGFGAVVLFSIRRARENPHIFLRRIPGLDAVEEAVGRATEMGRPVLYLTGSGELNGSGDPSNLSTIAATVILGEVAKRVATYGTELQVPHRSAIVMAICQEMVKESYLAVGRPDAYREEANFFITQDQFAYTAAVDGIMVREKPAANIFMGYYYAESLLLAETGASTGAIQIAGTDADYQLPFFITTCDYTLIGEELYAASAYLSREPALVGTLRGQDIGKGFLLGVLLIGSLLVTISEVFALPVLQTALQIFSDFR